MGASDTEFIHFSLYHQLDRIIQKYFKDEKEYVVLKINPSKLEGTLVFETNPGGVNKYYHLYEGAIPLDSIQAVEIYKKENALR